MKIKLNRLTATTYVDQFPICEAPCKENQRVEFTLIHDDPEQKLSTRKVEKIVLEKRIQKINAALICF
jgi:hypothetical protein